MRWIVSHCLRLRITMLQSRMLCTTGRFIASGPVLVAASSRLQQVCFTWVFLPVLTSHLDRFFSRNSALITDRRSVGGWKLICTQPIIIAANQNQKSQSAKINVSDHLQALSKEIYIPTDYTFSTLETFRFSFKLAIWYIRTLWS